MDLVRDANLEALKRCVENNRRAKDFNLHSWRQPCGTYGCLYGNDMIQCCRQSELDGATTGRPMHRAAREYGLPFGVANFLFSGFDLYRDQFGFKLNGKKWPRWSDERSTTDRQAAINRILKLIAYIERKRAILYEADGRVNEVARRQEGNWMVCPRVAETLAVAS